MFIFRSYQPPITLYKNDQNWGNHGNCNPTGASVEATLTHNGCDGAITDAKYVFSYRRNISFFNNLRFTLKRLLPCRPQGSYTQNIPDGGPDGDGRSFWEIRVFQAWNGGLMGRRSRHLDHCPKWLPKTQAQASNGCLGARLRTGWGG